MAKGKKSFILYTDLIYTVQALTDVEAGQLFKHLLAYVNDQNPETTDKVLIVAFEPIKQQLKRDLKDWEEIREKRRLAGIASAEAKQHKLTSVDISQQPPTNSTVNVTVTDSVTDSVNVKEKKPAAFRPDLKICPDWMKEPMKLWLKHKSEKKQSYKETGFNQLVEEWKKNFPGGVGLFDAVRKSVSNNYSGVFPVAQNNDPLNSNSIADTWNNQ